MSVAPVRYLLALGVICLIAQFAHAVEITSTDGKVYSSTSFRRVANGIMIKVVTADGGMIEVGLPIARITKIAFAEPPELAKARTAADQGNANEVLLLTDSFVSSEADFKDIPGSWWPAMAKLRLLALAATEKDADAAALARQIGSLNMVETDTLWRAGALFASLASGDSEAVVVGAKYLPRLGGGEGSALAQIALGRALLLKKVYPGKDFPGAIRAFLTVKVFYPSITILQPEALYGAANAYIGLKDKTRALRTLQDIEKEFPDSMQAEKAKKLESDISKS